MAEGDVWGASPAGAPGCGMHSGAPVAGSQGAPIEGCTSGAAPGSGSAPLVAVVPSLCTAVVLEPPQAVVLSRMHANAWTLHLVVFIAGTSVRPAWYFLPPEGNIESDIGGHRMSQEEKDPEARAGERGGSRRRFLGLLVGVGSLVGGAVLAVPGVAYLADPWIRRAKGRRGWRVLGDLGRVRSDAPIAVDVVGDEVDAWTRSPARRLGTVWLRRSRGGEVIALSAECPHFGCKIGFDARAKHFACPCHKSSFDLDGKVLSGPSPRPMDTLEARAAAGKVEVRFVRFRNQVPDKTEVG